MAKFYYREALMNGSIRACGEKRMKLEKFVKLYPNIKKTDIQRWENLTKAVEREIVSCFDPNFTSKLNRSERRHQETIVLSMRNGKITILDGGHRLEALKAYLKNPQKYKGIKNIYINVSLYECDTLEDELQLFVYLNLGKSASTADINIARKYLNGDEDFVSIARDCVDNANTSGYLSDKEFEVLSNFINGKTQRKALDDIENLVSRCIFATHHVCSLYKRAGDMVSFKNSALYNESTSEQRISCLKKAIYAISKFSHCAKTMLTANPGMEGSKNSMIYTGNLLYAIFSMQMENSFFRIWQNISEDEKLKFLCGVSASLQNCPISNGRSITTNLDIVNVYKDSFKNFMKGAF